MMAGTVPVSEQDGAGDRVRIVLFSGGRGSKVLSRSLITNPHVELVLAINGYDDGKSTGEVRRFLQDSLGPSDFRKNAARMLEALYPERMATSNLLDLRLPEGCSAEEAAAVLKLFAGADPDPRRPFEVQSARLVQGLAQPTRAALAQRLDRFEQELQRRGSAFEFSDCAVGNLVFAGCFLHTGRDFNRAVADYCELLGLPTGLIEDVTDGADAHLVAIDHEGRLLGSEAEIVDANARNRISDIFLLDHPLPPDRTRELNAGPREARLRYVEDNQRYPAANPRLLEHVARADVILYAPGTQHSSLLPSYLTLDLAEAIASNLRAVKLLVTNIGVDAELLDTSAVEIVEKALFYLRRKDTVQIPTPCLITHYLINDSTRADRSDDYVSTGRLQALDDPRLIRIGDYEEGVTGHHDAQRILQPFIESYFKHSAAPRVAVLLLDTESPDKIAQTLIETWRGGLDDCEAEVEFFCATPAPIDRFFSSATPLSLDNVWREGESPGDSFARAMRGRAVDYVLFFESSGMYRGQDLVKTLRVLEGGRLDAVWGSRRLSKREIRSSYKFRYRHKLTLGTLSYVGSHLLSLAYLLLYGRYVSDTLSGVRAVRKRYFDAVRVDPCHDLLNQHLLATLLCEEGDLFETPVRFLPISPQKIKRTTPADGLRALATILGQRLRRRSASNGGISGRG